MQTLELKSVVVNALEDVKAKDIVVLDVREKTSITDYMVIASGTSTRHLKSLADNVLTEAKSNGFIPLGSEGGASSDWILVDLGDVVVHVMMPSSRHLYDLERFWQESPAAGELAALA
jgi:ribosome-associated protein